MAAIPGTTILNTGGTAADQPASNPLLTAPSGGAQIVGFVFTNPYTAAITVSVYKDGISAAQLLFTVSVPALAGMSGGPSAVTQLQTVSLGAGETIYAQSANLGGFVNVEIDGQMSGSTQGMSVQQMQLAQLIQFAEITGADIPDANMLLAFGYNM